MEDRDRDLISNGSTVLVTGAAGGIGWAITKLLRERGFHVLACDNLTTGLPRDEDPGVTWLYLDVAGPELPKRLSAFRIEAAVHCAARLAPRSLQEPSADVLTNCFGSMQVFEWCARAGVQRVLFLSSSAVYGDHPYEPIKETTPVAPETIYAVGKVACEHFLRILEKGYGLPWTVLRLFPTYGPYHRPSQAQGIVNVMLTQLMNGNEVIVKGSLERVRDLVYVDDTARAIVDSLFAEKTRDRVLNVGTGKGHTIRELIYLIAEALNRRPEDLRLREIEGTPGDPFYQVADISAIKEATGFSPSVDLRTGVERLVRERSRSLNA